MIFLSLAVPVQATPPSNDDWASAMEFSGPFSVVEDATDATRASDEPEPGCTGGADDQTVWYRYTASANGQATASFAGSVVEPGSYPSVVVFSEAWDMMACRPSVSIESPEPPASMGFHVFAGYSYLVRLGTFGAGAASMSLQVTESSTPLDDLNRAVDEASGGWPEDHGYAMDPGRYPTQIGSLPFTHSRSEAGVAFSTPYDYGCANQDDGLAWQTWYRYTPAVSGPLTAHLAAVDAFLALFEETGGELLRCELETRGDLVFKAHAGATYLFAVAGPWPEAYTFELTASGTPAKYDDRADARALVEGVKYFNVAHAVREPGEPNPGVAQTLWFRYKATQDGVLHLNADYRAPASYYPDLATEVHVWDDAGESAQTFEDGWAIDAGRTYEIQVGTESEGDGQYRISLSTGVRPDPVTGLVGSLPEPDLSLVSELACWATYCDIDE